MSASGSGSGLGKLILCGEHAVVYGHPALAFAIDRSTTVDLSSIDGPLEVDSGGIDDPRLSRALRAALPEIGVRVQIRSDIPVGRGMGSSAALSVALVRARAAQLGQTLDLDEVFAQAMPLEQSFHGNPSGLDVAVSCRGGLIQYRRAEPPEIESLPLTVPWSVVVLDTEKSGDTAALVSHVAARRPGIDTLLEQIGAVVQAARLVLADPRALGELLSENQRLLKAIGVSCAEDDRLVQLALDAGAYGAKLSGAGGGGVVLALVDDPAQVMAAAAKAEVVAFPCGVGSA